MATEYFYEVKTVASGQLSGGTYLKLVTTLNSITTSGTTSTASFNQKLYVKRGDGQTTYGFPVSGNVYLNGVASSYSLSTANIGSTYLEVADLDRTVDYTASSDATISIGATFTSTSSGASSYIKNLGIPESNYSGGGSYTITSGSVDSIILPKQVTACGSPTSVTISQSNGTATISWSGARSGTSNTISSYYIQYRTSSSGSWINLKSVTSTSTSGSTTTSITSIKTGYYQVQVQTRGSAGSRYYSDYKTSSSLASATVVSAPTTVSLSQSNGTLTISWSGARSGTSNTIVGYDIQYRTSSSGSYATLSSITSTSTSGSTTTSITSITTGYYQVQIRTKGSQGTNYYSGYKASSSIASATSASAPTAFTVSPSLTTGYLTLSWSGARSGTSNTISSYYIQYRTSSDASTWGSWTGLATKTVTTTSSSYSYTTSISDGIYIQYQIRTQGSQGSNYYSGYKSSSNYTRINTPPATISSVSTTKTEYSQGDSLTLSWIAPTDIDENISSYQIYSLIENGSATYLTSTTSTSYTLIPTQANNQQRVQYGVRAVDELGEYSPSIKYSDFITRDDVTGLKIYTDGEYKKAYIYVCQNGVYNMADIYVCSNGSYSQAID